jgi:tetratricopeptide (TPR) repeat protein
MTRSRLVVLALALSAVSAPAQDAHPAWAGAAEVYQRKQVFVAAVRDLSISLTGRVGDEGRRLRADIDTLETALRGWDQAIGALEAALRARGLDAESHTALGTVYLDRFRLDDAVRAFDAAAGLDPRRVDVHRFTAMVHDLAGRPTDAVRALTRAAAIQPGDVVTSYEIARHVMEMGDASPAQAGFTAFQDAALKQLGAPPIEPPFTRPGLLRQSSGVAPIFPPALYVHAFELLMTGRFEQAIGECRKALENDLLVQQSAGADRLIEGSAALRRGDVPGALKQLAAAVEADPSRSEAHRLLGIASRLDEQLEQSVAAYSAAVRLQPADERARLGLADVLMDMERFDEAERLLRETARVLPQGVQAQYRLGRLLQSRGQYDEALKGLEYAAGFTPLVGQDPLFEMVALIYANQADFERATQALRKQVAVNPNNADAHRRLGDGYVRLGRTMEALTEFLAALLVDRNNVLSHVGIAQLQFRSGNHAESVRSARAALALDPAQQEARYVLAMSLMRLGQADEARRELAEFERLQAQAAAESRRKFELDGLRRQVAIHLGAADHQNAISLLRQIIGQEPEVATHYVTLGLSQMKLGQAPDAIQSFEAALQRAPADPNVFRYLAEAYLAAGRPDASRQAAARYRESIESAKKLRALRFGNPQGAP